MTRPIGPRAVAGVLAVGLLALAFVAGPQPCEGGLGVYALAGLLAIVAMACAPWLLDRTASTGQRLKTAALSAAIGIAVWIIGFFAADFRIVCRLF